MWQSWYDVLKEGNVQLTQVARKITCFWVFKHHVDQFSCCLLTNFSKIWVIWVILGLDKLSGKENRIEEDVEWTATRSRTVSHVPCCYGFSHQVDFITCLVWPLLNVPIQPTHFLPACQCFIMILSLIIKKKSYLISYCNIFHFTQVNYLQNLTLSFLRTSKSFALTLNLERTMFSISHLKSQLILIKALPLSVSQVQRFGPLYTPFARGWFSP